MAVKILMKNSVLLFSALALLSSVSIARAREIDMNTAKLQAMNKLTGRVSELEAPVNSEVKFGSFSIVVRACKARAPEETPDNFAFVDVVDTHEDGSETNIFKGWMISSSPALHAIEHPIYDVWLLQCENTQVDASKLLNADELAARDEIVMAEQLPEQSHLLVENEEKNIENIKNSQEMPSPDSSKTDNTKVISSANENETIVDGVASSKENKDTVFETDESYVESEPVINENNNLVIFKTEPAPQSADGPESLIKPDSSDAVLLNSDTPENGGVADNRVDVVLPNFEQEKTNTISENVSQENADFVVDDGEPDQLIMFDDDFENIVPQSL